MARSRAVRLAFAGLALAGCTASAPPASSPRAAEPLVFVQAADELLEWDFEVHGLPAMDPSTGAVVVADVSHGYIASSLSLSLRWLRPHTAALKTFDVLGAGEASRVLYELDEAAEPTAELAKVVRTRTRAANAMLNAHELRPMVSCTLPPRTGALCVHPQRVTCGSSAFELRGDVLSWSDGSAPMGWTSPPIAIGDGPPKEMVTCLTEAHFDPTTRTLAARIEPSCKEGGGDACFFPEEWRAVTLTPGG